MGSHSHLPQVGAPDPELKTSPIFDRVSEGELSLDLELEYGFCYFNGITYPLGSYVLSGSEVLHCAERGIWVRTAEEQP